MQISSAVWFHFPPIAVNLLAKMNGLTVDVLAWSSLDASLEINVLAADDAQRAAAYCACKIITMLTREVLVTCHKCAVVTARVRFSLS